MTSLLKKAWDGVVAPMVKRPNRIQVAALCYRNSDAGSKEVLLITSLHTGRWILPKGWPMDGLSQRDAALQEAFEEAGIARGEAANEPIGSYDYNKVFDGGAAATCTTQVYPIEVKETTQDFPEQGRREIQWVAPEKAAELVEEPQLGEILRRFAA